MENQILFKLGAIGSQVESIRDDITKVVRRLEERIDDDRADIDRSISALKNQAEKDLGELKTKVLSNETRLNVIDEWKKALTIRWAMILSAAAFLWLLFGAFIIEKVGVLTIGI